MSPLIKKISLSEWQFVFLMSLLLIFLTSLPYLVGYWLKPDQTVYNGLHALSPGDIPIYYSYLGQIKNGNFLLKDLFTSEVQTLGTFNIWWFLVGGLTKVFNWSVIVTFQLARLSMIPIFTVVAYLFLSYFFKDVWERKLALIFLFLSSGLGFYFAGRLDLVDFSQSKSYWWPIDLWLTEAVTFNALYQSSHFIASLTFMLLIFLLALLAFDYQKISYAWLAGLLSLIYFNFHPYYLPVIFGSLGFYWLFLSWQAKTILWRQFGYLIIIFLLALPSVFYHFWLIKNSLVISQRALQNVTLISPVVFVIIGYGWLWLLALTGLFFLRQKKAFLPPLVFLLIWLLVNLFLIYSALPFHSRYTQGLHLILVIFSIFGLRFLFADLKNKLKPNAFAFWLQNPFLLALLFLTLLMPSNLYSLARDFYYFTVKPPLVRNNFYLPHDVVLALQWLAQQPKGQIILAADVPSKFIPGFSGQTVYAAHAHETLDYFAKLPYVLWIFANNQNDLAKAKFLRQKNIGYIFYSQYEKELGDFNPVVKDYLKLVFALPQAQIYQLAE